MGNDFWQHPICDQQNHIPRAWLSYDAEGVADRSFGDMPGRNAVRSLIVFSLGDSSLADSLNLSFSARRPAVHTVSALRPSLGERVTLKAVIFGGSSTGR